MKKFLYLSCIIAAVMLLLPLSVIDKSEKTVVAAALQGNIADVKKENSTSFKVCDGETGEITEITTEDYIFGVVAAEMPALYEEEALKAQAVAAYTFACVRKAENTDKSYDITTDHTTDQSFITEADARKKWGDKSDEYTEKIKNAVKDTSGYMITYNGKPITSVYHAISGGKTEDAKDVWGVELKYLKPVTSEGDKLSSDYISEVTFTADELKKKLSDELELSGEEKSYFGNSSRTDSGMVQKITVCGKEITGARLRSLLGLRSSNFEIKYSDSKFKFTVYGYGHGVGMSQNGANYMAKQGSNFKEILTWYYTDCKVEKVTS